MPRKRKILKEHILDAALNLMKEEGFHRFTARRIATHLNASTQPIYKEFKNMDDLKENLLEYVKEILEDKVFHLHSDQSDLTDVCINYVYLASKESTLFSALFMDRELSVHSLHKHIQKTLHQIIQRTEGLEDTTEEDRQSLLDILWPAIHGFSVLTSQGIYSYSDEEIARKMGHIVSHSVKLYENKKAA